ncbi:L,D-transpeptidase family protein [Acuticoccus kandeliae]|uniref:L,D-transpeptidase family protein n=1 Tax=Acuticoccus kandeliae TaxID=2073160 RepID=UPI000D3E4D5D|nr:murein L,D-transpeptidase family protein [Acuticoccus kandeliae]
MHYDAVRKPTDRRMSVPGLLRRLRGPVLAGGLVSLALAGCQVSELSTAAHLAPVPSALATKIDRMGMSVRSPILLRIYKEESVLEVWKQDRAGKYKLLKEYEICAWSGELGPKLKEGDRQAPEGFYTVTQGLMNPNSSYHLAFNLGFPNTYDRSNGRTGSFIMVHGDCSSRGCYAMDDQQIQEIYALAREAFAGGQKGFQVQALPFRMTPENMARHHDSKNLEFWEMLKDGSDHFEVTGQEPRVDVCGRKYVFNARPAGGSFVPTASCPDYTVEAQIEQLVAAKRNADLEKRKVAIARDDNRKEREERWAAREKQIATMFNNSRSGADEPPAATPAAAETTVASATAGDLGAAPSTGGTPMPRPSPRGTTAAMETKSGGGFRIPNPFARKDEPVASVAAVEATPVAPAAPAAPAPAATAAAPSSQSLPGVAVSSTAGVAAAPPAAPTAPAAQAQAQAQASDTATSTAPPAALGYAADEEEGGFLSNVSKGSKSLFRRAGSLFN